MINNVTAADSSYASLVRTVEERVPSEIISHFSGMACYRFLRNGLATNCASLSALLNKRPRAAACVGKDISVESCKSRVLSCMRCQVLTGYCVLWVESSVNVTITSNSSPEVTARRREVTNFFEVKNYERHNITFLTLHIVDITADRNPARQSFALQSVCQPGRILQLECYPYQMVHFGLLMHILWRCPEDVFDAVGKVRLQCKKSTNLSTCDHTAESSSMTCFPSLQPLLETLEDSSVLILGLGGNVIGNCLNAALSLHIPIDIIEVEPAVFETCRQHGQVPPCIEEKKKENNMLYKGDQAANVWVVQPEERRHPRYHFVIGDARELLRECSENENTTGDFFYNRRYSMIFLDCYDPDKEQMMHDGDIVDMCRSHLCPGGALIVNAHILPIRETLEEQFLQRGFCSVQVLNVEGCVQSIVVCLAAVDNNSTDIDCSVVASAGFKRNGHENEGQSQQETRKVKQKEERVDQKKQGRFCLRHARQMARYIHEVFQLAPETDQLFRSGFVLDAEWLKSSRALEGAACPTRVWEHYA